MKEAAIEIEKLAFGGAGFGRVDGKACFVPYTAPGDRALIRITREKRSYMEGELSELQHPSPDRVQPPCPIFGRCGGCDWQHISYESQLSSKQEIFAETLHRIGRVEREAILPIIPSPEPYAYRSRVQFKLRWAQGRAHIGFYRSGTHFVENIPDRCAIAHPAINSVLADLRAMMDRFPEPDKAPQADVAVGADGATTAIIHYIGGNTQAIHAFLAEELPSVAGLFLQCGKKSMERVRGSGSLTYAAPSPIAHNRPLSLSFSAGGFSQVNYRQNSALVEEVCKWSGLTGKESVLELFCGNGNFSIPLSALACEVIALEASAASVEDAVRNAAANNSRNIRFEAVDAVEGARRLAAKGRKFDLALLDPPRTGALDLVKILPTLDPQKIIYISCDPATLARDLEFLQKSGYVVLKSRPVDMFPQTYHMESVTLLSKI